MNPLSLKVKKVSNIGELSMKFNRPVLLNKDYIETLRQAKESSKERQLDELAVQLKEFENYSSKEKEFIYEVITKSF